MVASLIYYSKFAKSLTSIWFEIYTYDPCVANKVIDVSQIKICFRLYYCKLCHREHKANYIIIK